MSYIYVIVPDGNILAVAGYTLEPKAALVAYIMQYKHGNYNTWDYPLEIPGMRMSEMTKNWYYNDADGSTYVATDKRLSL